LNWKLSMECLLKQTLEAFLELEMEEHLGYGRYAAERRGSGNSRNGTGTRTVRGDFGELEIETPRDGKGNFEPKLVAKRQTSLGNFSETVVSSWPRSHSERTTFRACTLANRTSRHPTTLNMLRCAPFDRIECLRTADVPMFQVFGSSHPVHIATRFEATWSTQEHDPP
jgi:hypothetical protein